MRLTELEKAKVMVALYGALDLPSDPLEGDARQRVRAAWVSTILKTDTAEALTVVLGAESLQDQLDGEGHVRIRDKDLAKAFGVGRSVAGEILSMVGLIEISGGYWVSELAGTCDRFVPEPVEDLFAGY